MRRLPDWLICIAILLAMLAASVGRREPLNAPAAPSPVPGADQAPISPTSPFAEATLVKTHPANNRGTAFAVNDRGVWLTASRVVAGCAKPAIAVADGWAAPAKVLRFAGDIAVLTTANGAPALAFARGPAPAPGERGFAPGFSRAAPGEVATMFMGEARQRLAWAEIGRTDGLAGPLFGFAGAPVLDASGAIAGMVLSDAPRRGRITAATREAMTQALAAARQTEAATQPPQPITHDNYGRAADALRRATSVVAVDCL